MNRPSFLHVFPTFGVGGAQTRFTAIANHLGPAVRHIIVPIDGRTEAREKLAPDLDVTFLQAPPRSLGMRKAVGAAREILRAHRPDMLITSNWGSIDWAMARLTMPGLRHLHMEDGFGPEEQDRQIRRRVLTRRLMLRFSQILLPSKTLLRIARDTWRLPEARLHYVPNGIDIPRFAQAEPMALPEGDGPVIGTIAALRPEKNILRLVEAFAQLRARRPARLVIVGDGPRRPLLERRAAQLKIAESVLFTGHSEAPHRWMAAFDVFALTSDTEQMPLSVLEAMAASRPIVSTDVGDVRDMVAPENLAFVVPREAPAVADALYRLLDDAHGATQIGHANKARADAVFSDQVMFAAFRKLMHLPPAPAPRTADNGASHA